MLRTKSAVIILAVAAIWLMLWLQWILEIAVTARGGRRCDSGFYGLMKRKNMEGWRWRWRWWQWVLLGFDKLFFERMMTMGMVKVMEMVKMMGRWAVVCRGDGRWFSGVEMRKMSSGLDFFSLFFREWRCTVKDLDFWGDLRRNLVEFCYSNIFLRKKSWICSRSRVSDL